MLLFELVKSGRMVCRRCGRKIGKGKVKVKIDGYGWSCLSCADSERVKKVIADMNGQ